MSRQKEKGTKGENKVVSILNASRIFNAIRQPGSGIYADHPEDILETNVFDGHLEVKTRKSVPLTVYKWLGFEPCPKAGLRKKKKRPLAVFMKRDHCPYLVAMEADDFIALCEAVREKTVEECGGERIA